LYPGIGFLGSFFFFLGEAEAIFWEEEMAGDAR
jgi:hypothetical protein